MSRRTRRHGLTFWRAMGIYAALFMVAVTIYAAEHLWWLALACSAAALAWRAGRRYERRRRPVRQHAREAVAMCPMSTVRLPQYDERAQQYPNDEYEVGQ